MYFGANGEGGYAGDHIGEESVGARASHFVHACDVLLDGTQLANPRTPFARSEQP